MNSVTARAAIRRLAPYVPPRERDVEICLDFNENTLGCAPAVLDALRGLSSDALARYPQIEAAEAAIVAAYGHSPATGLLTNGTDDAIQLATTVFLDPGDEVLVFEPSFALYRFYAAQLGGRVRRLQLPWSEVEPGVREFRFDFDRVAAAATPRTRLVFVANPNNPTGHLAAPGDLLDLCRRLPQAVIFADEAYAEFPAPPCSLLTAAVRTPNLLVSRTFSKAHGLAGLRLGCLFGPSRLLRWLRRAHSPYNVNAVAAACGAAAVRQREWPEHFAREVRAARPLIEATLRQLRLPFWRSQANFVLFDAGAKSAALAAALRARGVLVRDRGADLRGALRLSCGSTDQTARACARLREAWGRLS